MNTKKTAIVSGAGGFIGHHLIKRLKKEGYFVVGADLKLPEFNETLADKFHIGDLRKPEVVTKIFADGFDEVYQMAADMGGAGYIFTGVHDADVMHNSILINLNIIEAVKNSKTKYFYPSSACIYPKYNQLDPKSPECSEESAYPAAPDSEYGWEKLYSERLLLSYMRNYGVEVHIARFHNIFGPEGTWTGGKEKAPAAICRKIAEAKDGDEIEIWGDGEQTRSFLYIDECLEGVRRLMKSNFAGPVNIGSEEMVSINELVKMVADIAGKKINVKHIPGPLGVRGRNSDNKLIRKELKWEPKQKLRVGLEETYKWVDKQVHSKYIYY